MSSDFPNLFQQHFLGIVIFLQAVLYASLFLNVPLVREVIGIGYLTLIPGIIFIKLLKLPDTRLSLLEMIFLSVGFSIAFLMFTGLLLNQFGGMIGISYPLSTLPLSLVINSVILIGAAVAYVREGKRVALPKVPKEKFPFAGLALIVLPILSILGTYLVNVSGNNIILILMFVAVTILFIAFAFAKDTKVHKYYPYAIFMMALALLFQFSLISNYILPYGGDSPVELYVFRTTQINSVWTPTLPFSDQGYGRMNAMLSVTILPTVYSNMLGIDPTWVFKIIYPLIFAFIPLILYATWHPYIGKKFAFLAVFLFMAQSTFYTEMLALNRQIIAELFFALLLFVILNNKMRLETKFIGFAIFSVGLIFSHYALAEIFLVIAAAALIVSLAKKRASYNLHIGMVVLFLVAMFGWYIFTSGSVVYDSFITFSGYVTGQLSDLFNPSQEVLTGLGLAASPSLANTISRVFAYLTEIFIVIGIVGLVSKKTKFIFDRDFTVFALVATVFLVALIFVPGLSSTLKMTRFYHILLMLLAPFCIVGIWWFVKALKKHESLIATSLLIVVIIAPYFLFQTNFAFEVMQTDSWSIPLSGYRMDPTRLYGDFGYIDAYSVYGAKWASINTNYENNIAADNGMFTALTGYGLIWKGYVTELTNTTVLKTGEFVYLSYISINYEQETSNGTLPVLLNQTNVIYSNGNCEVRKVPG